MNITKSYAQHPCNYCEVPSTQLVEKKAIFLVSRGLSLEKSGERVWGSDSPVRDELSTYKIVKKSVMYKDVTCKWFALNNNCYLKWNCWTALKKTDLTTMCRNDTQVGWYPVSTFYLHQITQHHILSINHTFLTITDNQSLLGRLI